jgi:hypothetical protein
LSVQYGKEGERRSPKFALSGKEGERRSPKLALSGKEGERRSPKLALSGRLGKKGQKRQKGSEGSEGSEGIEGIHLRRDKVVTTSVVSWGPERLKSLLQASIFFSCPALSG